MVDGEDPLGFYMTLWAKLHPHLFENAHFQSIFACSASAVITCEK